MNFYMKHCIVDVSYLKDSLRPITRDFWDVGYVDPKGNLVSLAKFTEESDAIQWIQDEAKRAKWDAEPCNDVEELEKVLGEESEVFASEEISALCTNLVYQCPHIPHEVIFGLRQPRDKTELLQAYNKICYYIQEGCFISEDNLAKTLLVLSYHLGGFRDARTGEF